jgi:hypothetical protein
MRTTVAITLGLLMFVPLDAMAQRPVAAARTGATVLRFHYTPGSATRFVSRSTQSMPNNSGTLVTSSTMEIQTVSVDPDGTAHQRLRFIRMELVGPGVPEAIRARIASALSGVNVLFKQDTRGHLTDRRTEGEIPEEMRSILNGVLDAADQMGAVLPEGPVVPGATWRDQRTVQLGSAGGSMGINVSVVYTLRSVRGSGADQIASVSSVQTLALPQSASRRGVTLAASGNMTGECSLALGRGHMNTMRNTGNMQIHVTAGGRTVDMNTQMEHQIAIEEPTTSGPVRRR